MADSLLLFIVPFAVAAALPGPAQGSLVAHVISKGAGSSFPFVAGMVAGNLIWLAAAIFGLSAIALRFELLFGAIKWLGVVYLLFIAWKLWNAPTATAEYQEMSTSGILPGMFLTLGNPKAVVFFGAVLPHAFDMTALSGAQVLLILLLGLAIDLGIQSLYLLAAARARHFVRSERGMRIVNRSSAGLMAGSAALIAARS